MIKAFVIELWDRQQQRPQTVCYQDPSPHLRDLFAGVDGIPVAYSCTKRGFMGASASIWHLPQV